MPSRMPDCLLCTLTLLLLLKALEISNVDEGGGGHPQPPDPYVHGQHVEISSGGSGGGGVIIMFY